MCSVSMVMDTYNNWPNPGTPKVSDPFKDWNQYQPLLEDVLKDKLPKKHPLMFTFDDLVKMVEALKLAQEYDKKNNEPECADPAKAGVFDDLIANCAQKIKTAIEAGDAALAKQMTEVLNELVRSKAEITGTP